MNTKRMPFIVFEGLDGSGLSTQSFELKGWLEKKGYEVYLTKEPTDGLIGSLVRGVLRKELKVDAKTLALLFAADRMLHINNTISNLLDEGVIVISDRYRLSSYAFQSLEVDIDWLKKINEKSITPDLTFIIDTPPLICMRRIQKQRFHIELYEEIDKLEKIRERYHELAKEESNAFLIDGNRPIESVSAEIFKNVKELEILEGLE
ncbi:MAG: dTMP kinase [Methanophagales archaeon]|nr:dTMP kinase [Methanophagales archaeon]